MFKKEFTSFDTFTTVGELKNIVVRSRISNIYQLDAKTLLLKLHKVNTPPLLLFLEAGKRLHLTNYSSEKPRNPPVFCMALRKYLRSAWIDKIEQHEFERIVTFSCRTKKGILKLVLELFGVGNIILVNEKNEILQAMTFKRMRDRNIIRRESFQFPPSRGKNPLKINTNDLSEAIDACGEEDVVKLLARFLGIGGIYTEELLFKAGVNKNKPCNALVSSEVSAIFNSLQDLLSYLKNGEIEPNIVLTGDGGFLDVLPIRLTRYSDFHFNLYETFNKALDEFYIRTKSVETTITAIDTEKPNREVKKLKRMIAEQEKTCREGEERAKNYRSIGDSIYVNSSPLQTLFDKILSSRQEGKDWSVITSEIITAKDSGEVPCVFYESLDAKNSIIIVSVGSLKFSLSLRKTLFENAAGFYERGKRAKQKSVGAMRALDISRKKLTEIEAKVEEAEIRESLVPTQVTQEIVKREIKRKEWYEKFRWFVSSDDFLVVAGKDAVSNEVVVKKYTDSNDIVFHADVVGAPFVVVKTGQKEPSPKVISEAGEFAASLSRGWREGFGSVDVYWVSPEQLSKAGPSGEYVPHGAFAIKGKRNWLRNVPLRMSIGIISADKIEIIGGPPESVKAKTKAYVTVLPNDKKDGALFKKILRILSSSLTEDQRKQIGKESLEKIREFVPYRKGRIVKKL